MAKLFEINIPSGTSTLQLDSQRRGTIHYTVKNVSARAIDGRASLVALPQSPADPNHPVQKGWVKLDGKAERHFDIDGEDTFTVNVLVPLKSLPGIYSFRLDVNWVEKPDDGDSSQAIRFEIPAAEKKSPKWGLVALFAVLALIVLGGVTWLLLQHKTSTVPDLKGKTIAEATTLLLGLKPQLGLLAQGVNSTPENVGKIISQNPTAGAEPRADRIVLVIVGGVPDLEGKTVAEASTLLSGLKPPMSLQTHNFDSTPENVGKIIVQYPRAGDKPRADNIVQVSVGFMRPPVAVQPQPGPQPQPATQPHAAPQPPRP